MAVKKSFCYFNWLVNQRFEQTIKTSEFLKEITARIKRLFIDLGHPDFLDLQLIIYV